MSHVLNVDVIHDETLESMDLCLYVSFLEVSWCWLLWRLFLDDLQAYVNTIIDWPWDKYHETIILLFGRQIIRSMHKLIRTDRVCLLPYRYFDWPCTYPATRLSSYSYQLNTCIDFHPVTTSHNNHWTVNFQQHPNILIIPKPDENNRTITQVVYPIQFSLSMFPWLSRPEHPVSPHQLEIHKY